MAGLRSAGVEAMELIGVRLPTSADEVRSGTQWFTYRNDKAREQLGWEPRPHEETLEDTVRWQLDDLGRARGGPPDGRPRAAHDRPRRPLLPFT